MDLVENLQKRIALLEEEKTRGIAQVNAVIGGIEVCKQLLSELTAPAAVAANGAELTP